jgi:hypothetical protein
VALCHHWWLVRPSSSVSASLSHRASGLSDLTKTSGPQSPEKRTVKNNGCEARYCYLSLAFSACDKWFLVAEAEAAVTLNRRKSCMKMLHAGNGASVPVCPRNKRGPKTCFYARRRNKHCLVSHNETECPQLEAFFYSARAHEDLLLQDGGYTIQGSPCKLSQRVNPSHTGDKYGPTRHTYAATMDVRGSEGAGSVLRSLVTQNRGHRHPVFESTDVGQGSRSSSTV